MVRDATKRFGGDLKDMKRDIAGFGRDVRNRLVQPQDTTTVSRKFQEKVQKGPKSLLKSPKGATRTSGMLPTSGKDFEQLVNYDSDEDKRKEGFRIEDLGLRSRDGKGDEGIKSDQTFSMETFHATLRHTEREFDNVLRKADK
ncbi:hypothetical protein QYM36_001469, partial [Artemia franciscana]